MNIFNGLNNNTQGLSAMYKNTIQDTTSGNNSPFKQLERASVFKQKYNFQRSLQKNEYGSNMTPSDMTHSPYKQQDNYPIEQPNNPFNGQYDSPLKNPLQNQFKQKSSSDFSTPKSDGEHTQFSYNQKSAQAASNLKANTTASSTSNAMEKTLPQKKKDSEISSKEKDMKNTEHNAGKKNTDAVVKEKNTARKAVVKNMGEEDALRVLGANAKKIAGQVNGQVAEQVDKFGASSSDAVSHQEKEDMIDKEREENLEKEQSKEMGKEVVLNADEKREAQGSQNASELGTEGVIETGKETGEEQSISYENIEYVKKEARGSAGNASVDNAHADNASTLEKLLLKQKANKLISKTSSKTSGKTSGKTSRKKASGNEHDKKDVLKEHGIFHESKRVSDEIETVKLDIDSAKTFQNSLKEATMGGKASQQIQSFLKNEGNNEFVQQAKLILQGNKKGEIKLLLNPKEFGEVKLNFNLEDNKIVGRIIVSSELARDALQKNMDNLEKQFNHAGYEVGGFFVSVDANTSEKNKEGDLEHKNGKRSALDMNYASNEIMLQQYIGTRSETIDFVA